MVKKLLLMPLCLKIDSLDHVKCYFKIWWKQIMREKNKFRLCDENGRCSFSVGTFHAIWTRIPLPPALVSPDWFVRQLRS